MVAGIDFITKEAFNKYIADAASAAGYDQGFGVAACDLNADGKINILDLIMIIRAIFGG